MRIKILDWEKFNPRKDIKSSSWFRLENSFFTNPKFFNFTHEQKLIWLFILCQASQKQCDEITVCGDLTAALVKVEANKVTDAILRLVELKQIDILEEDVTRTSRGRNAGVRKKKVGRTATIPTDGRTDETDVTNERISGELIALPTDHITDLTHKPKKSTEPTDGSLIWSAYSESYLARYRVEPKRNQTTNSQCAQLAKRLGPKDGVNVVRFYLTHNNSWYVQHSHTIGLCLKDAEALYTQMLTDNRVTNSQAKKADEGSEQAEIFARVTKRLEEKYGGAT
jgi:hypothetical protein